MAGRLYSRSLFIRTPISQSPSPAHASPSHLPGRACMVWQSRVSMGVDYLSRWVSVWSLQAMQTLSLQHSLSVTGPLECLALSFAHCLLLHLSQAIYIYTPPNLSPAHSHTGASNLSLATLHYSILHISLLTMRAVYLCVQLSCNAHIWSCSSIWLNQK